MPISGDDLSQWTKNSEKWPKVRGCEEECDAWLKFISEFDEKYADDSLERAGAGATPYDRPENQLMLKIYSFIAKKMRSKSDKGKFNRMMRAFAKYYYPYYEIGLKTNLFLVVLFLLQGRVGYLADNRKRSQMAAQMLYGFRHRIKPELLVGFIYQSGGKIAVSAKAKDNKMHEPWFTKE
ncbi:hypothetical protein [Novosphingobium sp. CECT 9465]|uniref:hypothetical protein n=1 Tax=Novosphingobium sp. CECT 9465 TaxID=2829794 RepID=UPI001E358C17|nr:hypothetical protein [Novosphingobium sp. CECT 9465]CAH0497217.1 hypothetical protein NVSP9465_02269 [Novosphingobium sp. CECT 9465]